VSTAANVRYATALTRHATLMEIAGENGFRIRALQKAAEAIAYWPTPIDDILADDAAMEAIPSVGIGVILMLRGFAATGEMPGTEALAEKAPVGLLDVVAIPGVGPKTAAKLYGLLGVRDLDSLAAALEAGTVAATKGLGPNLAAKLEAGIAALARRSGRHRLGDALPIARDLRARLAAWDGGLDDEALQSMVFAVGKDHAFEPLRDWFKALYEVLLGASDGPRFGGFIALYGVGETIALIDRALEGALVK